MSKQVIIIIIINTLEAPFFFKESCCSVSYCFWMWLYFTSFEMVTKPVPSSTGLKTD
jgi:hypothetical protein